MPSCGPVSKETLICDRARCALRSWYDSGEDNGDGPCGRPHERKASLMHRAEAPGAMDHPSVRSCSPRSASQRRTILSADAEARVAPSGDYAISKMTSFWPRRAWRSSKPGGVSLRRTRLTLLRAIPRTVSAIGGLRFEVPPGVYSLKEF